MIFYTGKQKDRFCAHCGCILTRVRCYTGTYNTQTGKKATKVLKVCSNPSCYYHAPDDLMVVNDK